MTANDVERMRHTLGGAKMDANQLYKRAEQYHQAQLRTELERTHRDSFVAIEPVSGNYYLGRTLSEASAAASTAHPDRRCCVLRVGHDVTVHIGAGL